MKEIIITTLKKNQSGWTYDKYDSKSYECAGVWALKGKISSTSDYVYLEVAETKNISKEINTDINLIVEPTNLGESNDKPFYKFRSWSAEFVGRGKLKRTEAKYSHISNTYTELQVVLLAKEPDIENRYKFEVETAMKEHAKYWYPAPTNRKRCKLSQWALVKQYES